MDRQMDNWERSRSVWAWVVCVSRLTVDVDRRKPFWRFFLDLCNQGSQQRSSSRPLSVNFFQISSSSDECVPAGFLWSRRNLSFSFFLSFSPREEEQECSSYSSSPTPPPPLIFFSSCPFVSFRHFSSLFSLSFSLSRGDQHERKVRSRKLHRREELHLLLMKKRERRQVCLQPDGKKRKTKQRRRREKRDVLKVLNSSPTLAKQRKKEGAC